MKLSKKNIMKMALPILCLAVVSGAVALYILSNTWATDVTLVDSTGCLTITEKQAFAGAERFIGTVIFGQIHVDRNDPLITVFYLSVTLDMSSALEVTDATLDIQEWHGAIMIQDLTDQVFTLNGGNLEWKFTVANGFAIGSDQTDFKVWIDTEDGMPEGALTIGFVTSDV